MANPIPPSSSMASTNLPEEIVAEILSRLPVKDLLRLRTVCKSWPSIISNPMFIKSHLHRSLISAQRSPTLLTLEKETDSVVSLLLDSTAQEQTVTDHSVSPVCFNRVVKPGLFFDCGVVSSCNGIICLTIFRDCRVIYLWNPSIKQYKKLPVPERYYVPEFVVSWDLPVLLEFGYDCLSDDFKVVRIVAKTDNDYLPIVQLYSTNTDSWREFTDPILINCQSSSRSNTVINGVLYLHCGISFDLHEEVFRRVPFPSFATEKKSAFLDFKGSVAMVFECSDKEVTLCTLDTVSGTWTKLFMLEIDLSHSFYLGAGQFYGGKLLDEDGHSFYILYKIYDYKKKEIYYYRPPVLQQYICGVLKYTESLVSINGFERLK